jgi:hypothetical protein
MQERIREIRVQGEKLGMDENGWKKSSCMVQLDDTRLHIEIFYLDSLGYIENFTILF